MPLSVTDRTMRVWLNTQVRVLEAWREELAMRTDIDLARMVRLETHYHWLTSELAALEYGMAGEPGH